MYTPTYNMYRGDILTVQKGNVCASSWMDRKVVTALSTTTQPETGTVLRRQKDGTRISAPCPLSIIDYNKYMGGVDRGDQVRGYYSCRTKCRKFYKYIFHFLLDVAITNAYILQKDYCGSTPFRTIKEFRLQLASELIDDYCSRRRAGRGGNVVRTLSLRHYPTTIMEEDVNKKGKHKRARCRRCYSTRKKSVYTSWYCPECQLWLCHTGERQTNCFALWHARHLPEQN